MNKENVAPATARKYLSVKGFKKNNSAVATKHSSVKVAGVTPSILNARIDRISSSPARANRSRSTTPKSSIVRPMTPRTVTPRSVTPRTVTPRSSILRPVTPQTVTPRSVTSRILTPRSSTPKTTQRRALKRPREVSTSSQGSEDDSYRSSALAQVKDLAASHVDQLSLPPALPKAIEDIFVRAMDINVIEDGVLDNIEHILDNSEDFDKVWRIILQQRTRKMMEIAAARAPAPRFTRVSRDPRVNRSMGDVPVGNEWFSSKIPVRIPPPPPIPLFTSTPQKKYGNCSTVTPRAGTPRMIFH